MSDLAIPSRVEPFAAPAAAGKFRSFTPTTRARRTERLVAIATLIVPHAGAGAAIVWALQPSFPLASALWFLVVSHVLRGFGISIGFHRLVSHASFKTKPWLRVVFAALGMTAGQGPVLWWAAIHRRHHGNTECEGDPHSPYVLEGRRMPAIRGFFHAHMGWLFVHQTTSWHYYIRDLLKDGALFRANQLYLVWMSASIALPAAIGFAIYGTGEGALFGLLFGGLLPIVTVQHATWAINSVCHVWGTRPYCTGGNAIDKGRNNVLVAIVTLGEGWHNHHHAFASTADNQFRFWQFDPSAWVIYALGAVGLTWDIKKPSRAVRAQSRLRRDRLPPIFTTAWRSGRDPRLGQSELESTQNAQTQP